MEEKYLYQEETEGIISAFYEVYNTLGAGFLEKVYENALYYELTQRGFKCVSQQRIGVIYKSQLVGDYIADIVVNDCIILELKALDELIPAHEYQLINYLRATGYKVGLLLNFGKKAQVRRKVNSSYKSAFK